MNLVNQSAVNAFEEDFSSLLDDRLECIRQELNLSQRPRRLKGRECELLLELLEVWAQKESWDAIVEWASLAISEGCPPRFMVALYRNWMEALYRSFEWDGVRRLARHLLGFRFSSHEFVALSLYGLSLVGLKDHARRIARVIQRKQTKTVLEAEALAVYNLTFRKRKHWKASLSILEKVSHSGRCRYFTALNWAAFALDCDDHECASRAFNSMNETYPDAPEPIRTAVALAVDNLDWAEVVRLLRVLCRINPQEAENHVALATALEHRGEFFAARDVLKGCRHSVHPDDYDFVVTAGSVAHHLYQVYREQSFRTEAIRYTSRALALCRAYHLPSAAHSATLHLLNAGVGELSIPPVRREGQSGPSFWLCMVDDYGWKHGLPRRSQLLLRVPEGCAKGDFIFLARGRNISQDREHEIYGLLQVATPQIPDEYLDRVARLTGFKMFDSPVRYRFTAAPEPAHDGHGIYNFSNKVSLYFSEIERSDAEKIVSQIENLESPISFDRLVNRYA